MSSPRLYWSEKKIARQIKEGYGQGEGENYKPWYTVESGYSIGHQFKLFGLKTNRIHHFVSKLEYHYYLMLEWNDKVIDIRERFPLFNRDETIDIANELNMVYPRCKKTKTPKIITTDFMITVFEDGRYKNVARSVIPFSKKNNRDTKKQILLEFKYWQRRNVDFVVVTDEHYNMQWIENYIWFRTAYNLEPSEKVTLEELKRLSPILICALGKAPSNKQVREVCFDIDNHEGIPEGTTWYLFRHLLATKRIRANMNGEIMESCLIKELFIIKEENDA